MLELEGVAPGDPLPGITPDWIIEIDNKSLTHRPDLWGHYGMAREVAAITGRSLKDPVQPTGLPQGEPAVAVQIEDFGLCARYSALALDNVEVGASPLWLQARLESVGLNPINNIVDVTNYVLAELPQPMHAFDADKLQGGTIFVRRARTGERLAALNGETYDLTPADLVIADGSGPIALGRSYWRSGQRNIGNNNPRGAGERQLPGIERSPDLVPAQSPHGCVDAL